MYAKNKVYNWTIAAFFISLALCLLFTAVTIKDKSDIEKARMEQLVVEKSTKINEVISQLIYKTSILEAFIIEGKGDIEDFEKIADIIIDDPAILNVLIAPNGVVAKIYPLEGNEKVIGLNLLGPGAGNKEAIFAKLKGKLVFGGPFNLIEGGQGLVGRLPIFMSLPDGSKTFWGLVSVTLKYPQVLDKTGVYSLATQGFDYEIWRINPDDNQKQIIASNKTNDNNKRYIEKHMHIMDADWYFKLSPVLEWYQHPETWVFVCLSFLISFLIAFIVEKNFRLARIKSELENMVHTDFLTDLLNRKGLFRELERLIRLEKKFLLYYLDLDFFKQINDNYGHSVGDTALVEFSRSIDKFTDGSHIFARFSGDEFILVHVDSSLSEENMENFWQQAENELAHVEINANGHRVHLNFSKGVAKFPDDGKSADELIHCADTRMYSNKQIKKAQNTNFN